MERQKNESFISYCQRITQLLNDKQISYADWAEHIAGVTNYGEETLRRASVVFNKFLDKLMLEKEKDISDLEILNKFKQEKNQLIKERKKIQTENLQLQEQYRNISRTELLYEQVNEAIVNLEPIQVKRFSYTKPTERTGLLLLADQHFDSNFEVKGLFGEIINKYDKETFYNRMWSLLAQMDADKFDYDKLKVVSMGDCIEGLLRMTSLIKLRQPVVQSIIQFAEFMSQWLTEASNRLGVPIEFSMVGGNHGVPRYLTQKPEFPEENLEYIIYEFIKLRLKDEENIKIISYDETYFDNIHGINILFAHGENSNLLDYMNYYSNFYNIDIDRCYGAHLHSESSKSVGVADLGSKYIIRCPSICGTDTYAKSILSHNRAGCYFAIFSDNGEELNKIYYLN